MTSGPPEVDIRFSAAEIARRVEDLAQAIVGRMGAEPVIVVILRGGFVFAADLVRALVHAGARPEVDFMELASYGQGSTTSGEVTIRRDITSNIVGRRVLLVDDILDTGYTLAFARRLLEVHETEEVLTCVLIDKPSRRRIAFDPDFRGFACGDEFMVGYGMDLAGKYRGLSFVGAVVREAGPPGDS